MRVMLFVFVFHVVLFANNNNNNNNNNNRCVRIPRDRISGNWKHLVAAALACDSAESGVDLGRNSEFIAIGEDCWGCFFG